MKTLEEIEKELDLLRMQIDHLKLNQALSGHKAGENVASKPKPPEIPEVPEGWELTGECRRPQAGEDYLGTAGCVWRSEGSCPRDGIGTELGENRWILRQIPPKPTDLPDGWELTGEFRVPQRGEFVQCTAHGFNRAVRILSETHMPNWILRRKAVAAPKPRRWVLEEAPEGYVANDGVDLRVIDPERCDSRTTSCKLIHCRVIERPEA